MLRKVKIFYLTVSKSCVATLLISLSWCISWTAMHLYHPWVPACSGSCIPAQSGWVSHILNSPCHRLTTPGVHVFPQYLQLIYISILPPFVLYNISFLCSCFFHSIKICTLFVASDIAVWALYAFTLLANVNTCSLMISFVFLIFVNSHIISVIISSFIPFYKMLLWSSVFCFVPIFICLYFEWAHSFHRPFSCSFTSLQYCSDKIVSLCWLELFT